MSPRRQVSEGMGAVDSRTMPMVQEATAPDSQYEVRCMPCIRLSKVIIRWVTHALGCEVELERSKFLPGRAISLNLYHATHVHQFEQKEAKRPRPHFTLLSAAGSDTSPRSEAQSRQKASFHQQDIPLEGIERSTESCHEMIDCSHSEEQYPVVCDVAGRRGYARY